MDTDTLLVVGIVITIFAIPALVAVFVDKRRPRLPLLMLIIGLGLIGYVLYENPDSYTVQSIPDVFLRVIGQYI